MGDLAKVWECLRSVDTPQGRQRVRDYLKTLPFPHYEKHPSRSDLLIRVDAKGRRVAGRFVDRKFVAVKPRVS